VLISENQARLGDLGILYGGDYNPEQWPEEVWLEDVQLMQQAHVNCVSVAIFSWAKLEPRAGEYDFDWLDRIIDLLHRHGIRIMLATATASPPPWLSSAYLESLPVDRAGLRFKPGSRQHYCPNSDAYATAAASLAGRMAERYGKHPAVLMWHVNNEYACHTFECYCDVCRSAFRRWLEQRYITIDALNDVWGTSFWSQRYGQWDEIELPNRTSTFVNPGQMLDYRRFMNASILKLYRGEVDAIRRAGARQPVFTNTVFGMKWLDQFEWARHVDYMAVDMYPDPALRERAWNSVAFGYDVIRSAKQGNPFLLLEQATSQVNWRPVNQLKTPGMMRTLSLQALARGSDSVMFFQWRASRAGAEKFHSAMVPHGGAQGSRIFDEVTQFGAELEKLKGVVGSRVKAEVGLLFSFENIWALEIESKPTQFDAMEAILPWHDALDRQNITLDIVHPDADYSKYRVVLVPLLYQITRDQAERLSDYIRQGGTAIVGYFSGIADERDHIWLGGYPALLQDALGIRVEEWQPLQPGESASFEDAAGTQATGSHWADLFHPLTASVMARYKGGMMDQWPVIARNAFGNGQAYYVGTRPDAAYLGAMLRRICAENGVTPLITSPTGVECLLRENDTARYLFVINHTDVPAQVDLNAQSGIDLLTGNAVSGRISLAPQAACVIEMTQ
jgi:beta-galactosidase